MLDTHRAARTWSLWKAAVVSPSRSARRVADLDPGAGHRALLFDWDGTLADSQEVNYAVLTTALQQQGADLARGWFDARTGVSTRVMVLQLGALLGRRLDVDRAADDRDRAYLDRLRGWARSKRSRPCCDASTAGGPARWPPAAAARQCCRRRSGSGCSGCSTRS